MTPNRGPWTTLIAGCALATFVFFTPAPTRAGGASADAAAQDEPVDPDDASDETAPNDEDPDADEEDLVLYEDPDDEDGDGPEEDAGPDEELQTVGAYAGAPGVNIRESDGTLRPPPRLPVVGLAPPKTAGGSGSAGAGGGTPGTSGAGGGAGTAGGGTGTAATAGTGGATGKPSGRIFGGSIAREGVPWQAQLYAPFPLETWKEESRRGREPWEVRHYCGGSLIAPDWVLTAAHCVYDGMAEQGFRIRLGMRDISRDEGVSFPIDRIVVHPGWKKRDMYYDDIALIHIVTSKPQFGAAVDPRRPPAYSPIPLHRGPTPGDAQPVRAMGWGKTRNVEVAKGSAVLMEVEMNVLAEPRCAALPGYGPTKIHPGVVCATAPGRQTCRGDSGGPIVFAKGAPVLVGVVSWGKEQCAGDEQPGVYTRVGAYAPWIDSVIRASAR